MPYIHQGQTQRHQHQVRQPVSRCLQRDKIEQRRHTTEQTRKCTREHIAAYATSIKSEHARTTISNDAKTVALGSNSDGKCPVARRCDGKRTDDATAHAHTMHTTQKTHQKNRQE